MTATMPSPLPTGAQVTLRLPGAEAQITQVGASLRALSVGGVDLMPRYPLESPAPACAGVVLVPWPNRVRDGVWNDAGETRALAITEPRLNNAIHGLLRFTAYEIEREAEHRVTLRANIVPQPGYPYLVSTAVTYALSETGIEVTHRFVNHSSGPAPVALGTHPFVTIAGFDPAEFRLRVPANRFFETDDRLLPIAESPVPPELDLRDGRRLGDLTLDTGYAELDRDADGRVRHRLTAEDGSGLTLWQGPGFDYVQVFTTSRFPGQDLAVAIEPMTAPADAFNSGRGLHRLQPEESWTLSWGIEYSAA